ARQRELSEVRRHAPGASATVPGGRSAYVRFALIATELMQRREVTRGAKAAVSNRSKAAPYSITSSAATSRPGRTVRPSAFAVLRLRTVSYLVGVCTGRSAG